MKKSVTAIWMIALLTGIPAAVCQAETGYVSDMLFLTFRQGPGTNYAVLKTLKSNTPLKILKEENGFYNVSLDSGEQGWVDKKFIMFEPPKTVIIDQLNREKAVLENQIQRLKKKSDDYIKKTTEKETVIGDKTAALAKQVAYLQQANTELSRNLKQSRSEFNSLKQAAKDVSATLGDNKRLTDENKALSERIQNLENETRNMFRIGMIKWFLAGFGVLLAGWIIGKSVSPKRRRGSSLLD